MLFRYIFIGFLVFTTISFEACRGLSLYVNPRVYFDNDLNNSVNQQDGIDDQQPLDIIDRQVQQKRHKTCVKMTKGNNGSKLQSD